MNQLFFENIIMFESEDVDVDYFVPAASTTLADIFQSNVNKAENSTLKYVPPKPAVAKTTENKFSECIFACAMHAYEWANNVYNNKGKLGFAIITILKTQTSNIVLYDANKTTLSTATVQSSFKVKLKGKLYISYFDNAQKYWSLCGTEDEVGKICETLERLEVEITPQEDEGPPTNAEVNTETKLTEEKQEIENVPEPTHKKKSKTTILSRMASMGHAILPLQTSNIVTSDSSDTNDSIDKPQIRAKPSKLLLKKTLDKKLSEIERKTDHYEKALDNYSPISVSSQQIMPMPHTSIISNIAYPNELNLLMTEQRVNNSELRMTINRMSDRLDEIIKNSTHSKYEQTHESPSVNIYQKLLKEYEEKIQRYEEILKSKNISADNNDEQKSYVEEIQDLKRQVHAFDMMNKEKDKLVSELQNEIALLKSDSSRFKQQTEELEYLKSQIATLTEVNNITETLEKETENTIKSIMNETFQNIAENFNSDETYSGATIKKAVAAVIKKVTLKSLTNKDGEAKDQE